MEPILASFLPSKYAFFSHVQRYDFTYEPGSTMSSASSLIYVWLQTGSSKVGYFHNPLSRLLFLLNANYAITKSRHAARASGKISELRPFSPSCVCLCRKPLFCYARTYHARKPPCTRERSYTHLLLSSIWPCKQTLRRKNCPNPSSCSV